MADQYRTRTDLGGETWALPAGSTSTGTFEYDGRGWLVFPGGVVFWEELVEADQVTFERVSEAEMEEMR